MKKTDLPADQQFFADLFSGLVLNPHRLGRVWFASQPPLPARRQLMYRPPPAGYRLARRIR